MSTSPDLQSTPFLFINHPAIIRGIPSFRAGNPHLPQEGFLSFHGILAGFCWDSPIDFFYSPQWLLGTMIPELIINQQGWIDTLLIWYIWLTDFNCIDSEPGWHSRCLEQNACGKKDTFHQCSSLISNRVLFSCSTGSPNILLRVWGKISRILHLLGRQGESFHSWPLGNIAWEI